MRFFLQFSVMPAHGFVLLVLLLLPSKIHAATYNAYQYDMTVPQFTPDGRLLQTEYAQAAADHSRPILVVPIVAGETVLVATCRSGRTRQERLVIFEHSNAGQESGMVVAMAGVLADSLALLQKVQQEDLTSRQWYGTGLTADRMARAMAAACQEHAFGGGIRPFGATMLLVAATTAADGGTGGGPRTWRTDPSGAMGDRLVDGPIVMGGGDAGIALQRKLDTLVGGFDQEDSPSKRIAKVLSLLLQDKPDEDAMSSQAKTRKPIIEAALVSQGRGVLKLSEEQIRNFLSVSS